MFKTSLLFAASLALGPFVITSAAQSGPRTTDAIVAKAAAAKTPTAAGPFEPTWDSIRANYKVPQWFVDAKFGITMHWGLFSVPAYHNEWYEKYMYTTFSDWHTQNFGAPDKFGYKDFIPLFQAREFNADNLAQLVKDSGAKYFMPTVEHHDGFSLWDSKANPWNSMAMGPHRDLTGEMAVATRKLGLKFGVCSHNIEHYTFVNPKPGLVSDASDPKLQSFYWNDRTDATVEQFLEQWVAKTEELIDQYQPDVMWFDNGVNPRVFDPLKTKVAAYYYNRARTWGKEVTIETKDSAFLAGSVLDFEKLNPRGPTTILRGVWDAEEPIGSTWGYSAQNPVETFRNAQSVVSELSTILSMNGSLLLNLSPNQQGGINEAQRTTLHDVGKWLAVNGEAVYGTHAWTKEGEGFTPLPQRGAAARAPGAAALAAAEEGAKAVAAPEAKPVAVPAAGTKAVVYRFTVKGDNLYAIAQSWPGETATIVSLGAAAGKVTGVSLLGSKGSLKFTQDADGLKVTLPADKPCDFAYALKITGLKMNPAEQTVPAVMADLR